MAINEYDEQLQTGKPLGGNNEYYDMLSEEADAKQADLKGSMFVGAQKNPDEVAKVVKLSQKVGIDPDVVERNYADVEKKVKLEGNDYYQMLDKYPKTSEWMAEHPNNAALVQHDDAENVYKIETAVKDQETDNWISDSIKVGLAKLYSGIAKTPGYLLELSLLPENAFHRLTGHPERQVKYPDFVVNNPVAQYYDKVAKDLSHPEIPQDVLAEIAKPGFGQAGKALAVNFLQNAPNQAALLVGMVSGYGVPTMVGAGLSTAAEKFADNAAKGVDPTANAIGSMASGTFEAAFENLGTFGLLKTWENKIATKYGKEASKHILKDFAQTMFHSALGEGNEEFWTSVAQDLSSYFSGTDPNALKGIWHRAGNASLVGASSGMAMTGPTATVAGYARVAESRKVESAKKFYLALGESAKSTKLRERLPEAQRALVEKITKGTPVENIHIPVEAFDAFYQDKAAAKANELGISKAYNEAKEAGTTVKIPLASWVDNVVGTNEYSALANDIKFDPAGKTVNEAKAEQKAFEKQLKEQADQTAIPPENAAAFDNIKNTIKEQLLKTNADEKVAEDQAGVFARIFYGLGSKQGVDPVEFVKQLNTKVMTPEEFRQYREQPKQTTSEFHPKVLEAILADTEQAYSQDGGLMTDGEGNVTGRFGTQLVAQPYLQGKGINREQLKTAINKVLQNKKLTDKQASMLRRVYNASPYLSQVGAQAIAGEEPFLQKAKSKMLGSAGSQEALKALVDKYFYSNTSFQDNGDGTFSVHNSKGKIEGFTVREQKGRWRFEMVPQETFFQSSQVQGPDSLGFYSQLQRKVEEKMGKSATVDQVKALLKEVKEEERKWSGIDEFLKGKEKVKKEDLLAFIRGNQIEIKEVLKGSGSEVGYVFVKSFDTEAELKAAYNGDDQLENPDGSLVDGLSIVQTPDGKWNLLDVNGPESPTNFDQYNLPGGKNYREVLFTLPEKYPDKLPDGYRVVDRGEESPSTSARFLILGPSEGAGSIEGEGRYASGPDKESAISMFYRMHGEAKKPYKVPGAHAYGEAKSDINRFAHTRLNDRVDEDGKRVLFVEEIQSDWHQEGRKKGYRQEKESQLSDLIAQRDSAKEKRAKIVQDAEARGMSYIEAVALDEAVAADTVAIEAQKGIDTLGAGDVGVPDAPFKKTWHEFVMKRIIRMAAEQGYDRVAWTTGEQQAERYDLSKNISEVHYSGTNLKAYDHNGNTVLNQTGVQENELDNYIGKEAAQKLIDAPKKGTLRSISGVDLKVGGEGMKGFYDKILVDFANKFGKKFGAKVGESTVDVGAGVGNGYTIQFADGTRHNSVWPMKSTADAMLAAIGEEGDKVVSAGSNGEKVHSLDITPEMKRTALEEGFSLFQGHADARGMIVFRAGEKIIVLNPGSDFSTFMHESAHLYLEVMRGLVENGTATDVVKADFEKIRAWMGLEEGQKIEREHHEKFAEAFEGYLLEGKAPSSALREAFDRFRKWMLGVYLEIKKRESLTKLLSPEIRDVFDRMVATDEEIKNAQIEQEMFPLFQDPAMFGMTEDQAKKYHEKILQAERQSTEVISGKILKEAYDRQKEEWQLERDRIRSELEKDVDSRPEQIASAHLKYGTNPDGSALPEGIHPIKLDKKSVESLVGKDKLKELPRPYVYRLEGGVHVEEAAALFGFNSGKELIDAIISAPDRNQLLDQMADAKMKEIHGDMVLDGTVVDEAMKAVHNDYRAEAMVMELKHLASKEFATLKGLAKAISKPVHSVEQIKQSAEKIINGKKARDVQPIVYQRGEKKAAKEALDHFWKGDFEAAFDAKQKQLLNHELYRAAVDAQDRVEKLRKFAKKLTKTEKRAQIGKADYLEQLDGIMERFEFARVPLKTLDERKQRLDEWIKEKEANGESGMEVVNAPDFLKDESYRVNYKELTIEELDGIHETLRQINRMAVLADKALTAANKERREDIKKNLISSLEANMAPRAPDAYTKNGQTFAMRLREKARSFDVALLKMEQLFRFFDADKADGAWTRYIWNPLQDANEKKFNYGVQTTAKIAALLEKMPKGIKARLNEVVTVPGWTNENRMTRKDLLAVMLNTGTESSYDKLLRGMGWDSSLVQRMVDQLTDEEVAFVQGVWQTLRDIYPDIAKLQKEMTGLEPDQLGERIVTVRGQQIQGGYYPMMYDASQSAQGDIQLSASIGELTQGGYVAATTPKGHTKARNQRFAAPVDLDIDRLVPHLDRVLTDLSYRKWVVDMNFITKDKDIVAAVNKHMGPEYMKRIREWTKEVINDRGSQNDASISAFKQFFAKARQNVIFASMAFKSSVMLAQISGLGASIEALGGKKDSGVKWMMVGLKKVMMNPMKAYKRVQELSPMMVTRLETKDANLREKFNELRGKDDILSQIQKVGMKGIGFADMMVSLPTWWGAYEKALTQGYDEDTARREADSVVRLSQGSSAPGEKSAIVASSNELAKMITMFYTPFSALYARQRSIMQDTNGLADVPNAAARLFWVVVFPALLGEFLAGRAPDPEDEPEEWVKWFSKSVGTYQFQSIPLFRDLVGGATSEFGYTASPLFQAGESTARFGKQSIALAGKAFSSEDEISDEELEKFVKTSYKAASYWTGIPTRQVEITGGYLKDVFEGNENPEGLGEFFRNVTTGRKKK